MCECTLLVEASTGKPIEISNKPHRFIYSKDGIDYVLLENFNMSGIIDYAAIHEINNAHGVKNGYMLIIGEK